MTLTTNTLETIVAGLTAKQLTYRPTTDAWTIPGILEHMVLVEDFVLGPLQSQLADAPASQPEAPVDEVDAFILKSFADRTHKLQAPDMIQPTGKPMVDELLTRHRENEAKLNAMLNSKTMSRENRLLAMPLEISSGGRYRTMDGRQWILATLAHNERHTNQILEWISKAQ